MASDCPVCGEQLADGVLSRAQQSSEAVGLEESTGPAGPTEGGGSSPEIGLVD
ncbi:MAG TPA: hypothetical protein VNH38_07015 [Candidatus Dormibacteraeota bacterium]|nr:hypothetical protein [Candidatus Dormibacteraeota bacterium]